MKQDIANHLESEYPKEGCGLIIVAKGKHRYVPCRNISDTPLHNFVIDPEDYAKAEDMGEIVTVVHSHVNQGVLMSEGDRVMCNKSNLPWLIVSVVDGKCVDSKRYEPDGYVAPLVGRAFAHGILDCYSLVQDYYARELDILLPNFEREDNWWNKGDNLYMDHFAEAGCAPIKGPICKGDIIIMQVRSPVPNHAAVYIGDGMMLHHMYGRLSTRELYAGWYQEITRVIVRHKDMQS